jgi:hypothetical protein
MDKVQKLNSNECYTPSSEPFRMYLQTLCIPSSKSHIHIPDSDLTKESVKVWCSLRHLVTTFFSGERLSVSFAPLMLEDHPLPAVTCWLFCIFRVSHLHPHLEYAQCCDYMAVCCIFSYIGFVVATQTLSIGTKGHCLTQHITLKNVLNSDC